MGQNSDRAGWRFPRHGHRPLRKNSRLPYQEGHRLHRLLRSCQSPRHPGRGSCKSISLLQGAVCLLRQRCGGGRREELGRGSGAGFMAARGACHARLPRKPGFSQREILGASGPGKSHQEQRDRRVLQELGAGNRAGLRGAEHAQGPHSPAE